MADSATLPSQASPVAPHRPSWARRISRQTAIVLIVIVVVLALGRLALPYVLRHEINLRLGHLSGYVGHVDDVGVQVWHGGYRMHRLVITKSDGAVQDPFVAADTIQFSIAYRELIHGRVVSDIEVDRGRINFVNGPSAQSTQTGKETRWQDVIDDLFPIHITHLHFRDSQIRFVDTSTKPKVDIAVNHMELEADGLRNRPSPNQGAYPARIVITGQTIGQGDLQLHLQAEPLAYQPHFKLSVSLKGVSLPALNDFLLAYANVDVGAGTLDTYVEMTGQDGSFQGYAKPFFKDLKFTNSDDAKKTPWQIFWKELVAGAANLVKNKSNKQVATLIPFSGKFTQGTHVEFWRTVANLLRNGFIQALREGLEGSPTVKKETIKPGK